MGRARLRAPLVVAVGAALVVAACGGATQTAKGPSGPISVGVIAPFTGSAAEFGKLLSAPCDVATRLINQAGGVLGHTFRCVPIDDTGDPADAVPNVTKALATTPNLDIVSGLESNTAATTVPLVNAAKIPFITTNGLVSFNKTTDKYFWRMTPADNANGVAFAIWAIHKGYRRAAIVFENNIGSEGNLPGVLAAMPKLGGTITDNVTIPADAVSYSSVVERVIATNPQVLIFSADPQTSATFLTEYKQLNNGVLPPIVTATDSLTPDFFNAVTKAVGTQYVTQDIYLVGSYFSTSGPAYTAYKDAMYADPRTHAIASVITAVGPPASDYDGINVFALAMLEANSISGAVYNAYIPRVVAGGAHAVVVHTFAQGKKELMAGHSIRYVGVIGPVTFNRYHNSAGEFAANMFSADGSAHRVGIISSQEVSQLLG